jgi:tetratricopeptide (TPR) repeat protein
VKLVDAYPEEKQVWMQDYMEDKNQILNLYNTVTKEISNKINVFLTPEEQRLLAKTRTVNREAYDAYLKGLHFLEDFSAESLNKAMDFLNSAIDKDPDWAMLYASRAKVWMGLQQMGQESPTIAGPQLFENLNKALELDPDLAEAYFMKAMIAYLAEWEWDKSEKEFVRSLALNPSDALGRIYYAQLLVILNRPQEARAQGELAMDIDPLNPLAQVIYSALLVMLRDCKRAMQQIEKLLKDDPGNFIANNALFHAAYPCKDYDKTFKTLRNLLPHSYPLRDEVWNEIDEIYDLQGFVPAFKEITRYLEIYSNNNTVAAFEMVYLNIFADKPEKAMDWLEKSYMEHDPNMPYIATPMYSLDSLFGNPRFIEIVEKMNLPLPEKK